MERFARQQLIIKDARDGELNVMIDNFDATETYAHSNPTYLPECSTREEYTAFLEDYKSALSKGRTLVKAYLLETAPQYLQTRSIHEIFSKGISLEYIDDSLFRVRDTKDHSNQVVGLLEMLDDRYPVFFTTLQAKYSDQWVRQNVDSSPWMDRVWLSSQFLSIIWDQVRIANDPNRHVRLGFEHEAIYAMPDDKSLSNSSDSELGGQQYKTTATGSRNKSKRYLDERIGVLNEMLYDLKETQDVFHSLTQLQVPSQGKGSHVINYNGKVTNQSRSFIEQRAIVSDIVRLYERVTSKAEAKLWMWASPVGDSGFRIDGAPVFIQFDKKLSDQTFDNFVDKGLKYRNSRLRIGGYIHRRGKTKVHMSAIDRHLWQPFIMEVTSRHIMALLPKGTCGSTIHRLVTNIQRYLSPKIKVWLGEQPYEDALRDAEKDRWALSGDRSPTKQQQ